MERFYIGKFNVSRVNLNSAIKYIKQAILSNKYGYICVSNARSAYQSNHEEDYCYIQNKSLLTVPDGRPISWIAHNLGYKEVGQVAGNELFHALLQASEENGYTHYFYGSTPSTIDKMKIRVAAEYPKADIADAVSPPFQPIESFDIDFLAKTINKLSPTFFWIGLGAPKQERLMALLQPKLKCTICIGVGLVFEYYAGTVKRAPKWIRNMGLEWLYRDVQQKRKRTPPFYRIVIWTLKQLIYSKLKQLTF